MCYDVSVMVTMTTVYRLEEYKQWTEDQLIIQLTTPLQLTDLKLYEMTCYYRNEHFNSSHIALII